MQRYFRAFLLAYVFAACAGINAVHAGIIFESATLGTTGHDSGWTIGGSQILGSRFTLANSVQVTAVGGDIGNFSGLPLYAAILQLDPATGLPDFAPTQVGTFALAGASFTPDRLSSEVTVPLSVLLSPGLYGLVFGTGFFGSPANSQGFMPCIDRCGFPSSFVDTDLPGASYFFGRGNPGLFFDGGFSNDRFFVSGDVLQPPPSKVPEPSSLAVLAVGLLASAVRRGNLRLNGRRKRANS